ncbi:M23 family metallopeptidase [Sphingomonas sp.]|uniref:M23 family metallopeptidase n=1 Tax=Sphingomonas sp. TaxID=28214 RepID=UPI0035C82549
MRALALLIVALASAAAPAQVRPAPVTASLVLEGGARQGGTILGRTAPGAVLTLDGTRVPVAPDGRFLIAFDRDAAPSAVLAVAGGETRTLSVAPGGWRIEKINAPLRAGKSSAEFERLRPAELAEIKTARAVDHDVDGWRQRFRWPVTGRRSGQFGAQRVYQGVPGSFHSGTDVAVPAGTPVLAPADGVVVLATTRPFTLEGNLVILDHGMGLNSAFLHLSRIDVAEGQTVRQGEPIGRVGATGRATGPHMHWGMKWRDARIDPALLAGAME